ncbi:MAG: hypothetical protein MZW92_70100 [Comamonadaceae bacterium]|nr:hypothetical protein [Comamonadaceae bacterium]
MPKRFLRRHAWTRAAALAALPEGGARCGWTSCAPTRRATPRGWPSCARWSSADWRRVAELQGRGATRGWTSTAGCSRNCASACSRRSCARRSR